MFLPLARRIPKEENTDEDELTVNNHKSHEGVIHSKGESADTVKDEPCHNFRYYYI